MYADGQRHDEKRMLSQLNQECEEEGIDEVEEVEEVEVEEFEAENLGSPMKVEMIARKLLWDLASQ